MDQLNTTLETYLVKKAPAIPENWKLVLVKYLPWITLIILVLALPAVLALFGLSLFLTPFAYLGGVGNGMGYTLAIVVLAVTLVLEGLAIPGLFKRSISAWRLLYFSALLNAVYNILNFSITGLILGTVLSLYILFQIKSYYK